MHLSVRRAGVAGMVVLGVLALATVRAQAQPTTPAGSNEQPLFLGLPPIYAPNADVSFYYDESFGFVTFVDEAFKRAEQYLKVCDKAAFDDNLRIIENSLGRKVRERAALANEFSRTPMYAWQQASDRNIRLARMQHDIAQLQNMLDRLGKFEDRCPKEKKVGALMDVFIQGGAALAFQSNGFFRALDSFSDEQPTVSGGNTRSTGVFGGGARLNVLKINPTFFVEARFQTAFGAPSFQQTAGLSGFGAPGQAPFGESLVRENWGVPLLLGTTWSLGNVGTLGELGLDVYGGVTIANWTQSLAGGEAGLPGTPTYSVQQTRTSVDPTFGVGLRLPVIDFNGDGRADVVLGVYGELAFRQGSSVTTVSPSNGGLTYTGWVDGRTNAALMLRLSVPLGGGPLFRVD